MQISEDALKQAYRQMKTIRMFEERLHDEIMTGEIAGFTHLYAGQEAVAVGVCEHLDYNDTIASTHRGHGHCIAKGCDVRGMMLEIYGRADGICKGKGGSMHIADIEKGMLGANGTVAGGPQIVDGAAMAEKLYDDGRLVFAFTGDHCAKQSYTYETLNLALHHTAPINMHFETTHYSQHTDLDLADSCQAI